MAGGAGALSAGGPAVVIALTHSSARPHLPAGKLSPNRLFFRILRESRAVVSIDMERSDMDSEVLVNTGQYFRSSSCLTIAMNRAGRSSVPRFAL